MTEVNETIVIAPIPEDIKSKALLLLNYKDLIKVTTEEQEASALERYAEILTFERNSETHRKGIVGPMNLSVKRVNNLFHAIMEPVHNEALRLKHACMVYRSQMEAERLARQAELDAAALATQGDDSPIPEAIADVAVGPAKQVQTASYKVSYVTVWKWKIKDEAAIPRAYLIPNEGDITRAVKGGAREIDGLEIYSEQVPSKRG